MTCGTSLNDQSNTHIYLIIWIDEISNETDDLTRMAGGISSSVLNRRILSTTIWWATSIIVRTRTPALYENVTLKQAGDMLVKLKIEKSILYSFLRTQDIWPGM